MTESTEHSQLMQQMYQAVQQQLAPQIHELQQQVARLQASSSSSSSVPPSSTPLRDGNDPLMKLLSKPSTFSGEHGSKIYDWLSEFEIIFDNCQALSDERKIAFAKQFLREEALRWWVAREAEVHRQEVLNVVNHTSISFQPVPPSNIHAVKAIRTWIEFKQCLIEYFCPRAIFDSQ